MSPERQLALPLEDPAPLLRWLEGSGPEPEQLELLVCARAWVRVAVTATKQGPQVLLRAMNLVTQMENGEHPEALKQLFPEGRQWDPGRFRMEHVTSFEKIEPFA